MAKHLEITMDSGHYVFKYRNADYCLRFYQDRWELLTQRQNYGGRMQLPSFRAFATLEELEDKIKGLAGISKLIGGYSE